MEDRETARMRKYGESKTTRIMIATVPYVTSGLGLRKFQANGFLLTRVYTQKQSAMSLLANFNSFNFQKWKFCYEAEIKKKKIYMRFLRPPIGVTLWGTTPDEIITRPTENWGYGILIKKYRLSWKRSVHMVHDNRLPKLAYFYNAKGCGDVRKPSGGW